MKLYIAKIASILLGAEEPDIASLNFYRSKGDLFYEFSATGAVSADQKFTFSHAMEMQKQIALQIFFRLLPYEKDYPELFPEGDPE